MTWRRTHALEGDRERSAAHPRSEGARNKARWGGTPTGRASLRPVERDSGDQLYPLGQWTEWSTPQHDVHDQEPADQDSDVELSSPLIPYRASVWESPSACSATGITTGLDLQLSEEQQRDLARPVRTPDSSDPDHLFPINPNETPSGPKRRGPIILISAERRGSTGGIEIGNVTGTLTHQTFINPNLTEKTKTTNPIVHPHQAEAPKSPSHQGVAGQVGQIVDNPVVRQLFRMPDEAGPQIRMPWFHGKPDEKVERSFRELERLKAIYGWDEPKTLNMTLHGLKGRADDWAHGLEAVEKNTFQHLKESMIKIFGDRRAVWQNQTDFFALRRGKDQTVLDFAGTIKQHQGKAEVGQGTALAVFLEGLKGSIAKQVAIQDPKTFDEAVANATSLESLDKTKPGKVTLNLIESEHETESLEGVPGIVERLGMVLARIEAAPWNQNPNRQKEQGRQGQKGYAMAEGSKMGSQQGGKTVEANKTRHQTSRNEKGFDQKKNGMMFKKTPFNTEKFCIYGHATDDCSWLIERAATAPHLYNQGKGG